MGVAATLPELSEWTLPAVSYMVFLICGMLLYRKVHVGKNVDAEFLNFGAQTFTFPALKLKPQFEASNINNL